MSVRRAVDAGHRVTFDSDGAFIEDKITGENMWLRDGGGIYMLRMWVKTKSQRHEVFSRRAEE